LIVLDQVAPILFTTKVVLYRGGRAPDFLDLHYKIDTDTDRVAKFRGDRPRELGDPMAN